MEIEMEDGTRAHSNLQASHQLNGAGVLEGDPLDAEGRFEMIARQVLSLTDALVQADRELHPLRQVVEECLEPSAAQNGSNGSHIDGDAAKPLHKVMGSVEAVAERFEEVSQAAVFVSTQALTRLAQELQRAADKLR